MPAKMQKAQQNPKPPQPSKKKLLKLRPKTAVSGMTRSDKLDLGQTYISAQASSAVGAQIVPEVTSLKTIRQAVITKEQEYADIKAQLEAKSLELAAADQAYEGAIQDYALKAAKIAAMDITVLTSLGVDAAATTRVSHMQGPAEVVTDLRLLEGPTSGSVTMRWTRPVGAAAFLVQYKLEESPGAPPAEWLPAEGFATKRLEWTIQGLPPAAELRGRVRAIGAESGAWSDEVLGNAR